MKSTLELYNIDPSSIADIPYKDALNRKIAGARFAMRKYRALADEIRNKNSHEYFDLRDKYLASEKALNHTQYLIDEINIGV